MDLILDTHVALWWASDPDRLAATAVEAIEDNANTVWFSAASTWELAIKAKSGKLQIDVTRFVGELDQQGVRLLDIEHGDAIAAGLLKWSHRDPFDRMLAAQTLEREFTLFTRDGALVEFLGKAAATA